MQGKSSTWPGYALAALLLAAIPATADDFRPSYLISDLGCPAPAGTGQLVSANMSAMNFEARIAALEAALAEKNRTDVSDQKWTGKVGGRVVGDTVLYPDVDPAIEAIDPGNMSENYFEFRRVRISLSGTGYDVYDYKLQLDWERGEADAKDLYVGIHEIPLLGYVRFGHFRGPSGLELLTNTKCITFMERALSSIFTTGRKVGVAAFNNSANDTFHINYGAFFNDFNAGEMCRVDDAQGVRLGMRGVWTPIYTANGRGVLHLGGSIQYVDDADDRVRFHNRPEVHLNDPWLDTQEYDASTFNVFALELASVYGPWSLQSELFYTQINGIGGAADTEVCAAYVYGSWFLTGESRNYDNRAKAFECVTPNTNFWIVPTCDGPAAGWGAWELAARWSYADCTDAAFASVASAGQMNDLTVGLNWYWNPHTRVMFEYIHPWLNRNDIGVAQADILGMRMQVSF